MARSCARASHFFRCGTGRRVTLHVEQVSIGLPPFAVWLQAVEAPG